MCFVSREEWCELTDYHIDKDLALTRRQLPADWCYTRDSQFAFVVLDPPHTVSMTGNKAKLV